MWERYGASAWTTCRSTANATSGGSGPSTRDIATSTGRTSRAKQRPPLHESGRAVDVTARIKRTHAVQGLISEYRRAA